MLDVIVNGESRTLAGPVTIKELIQDMELQDKRIAIEINGEIVPASQHSNALIADGDHIEIVGAIGGG
jgi:sulfur carrier protein